MDDVQSDRGCNASLLALPVTSQHWDDNLKIGAQGCNASVLLLPPAFPLDCNPVCRRLLCCLVWFELYIMYVTKM